MEKITSLANPKIKNIARLRKAGERKKQNLVVVEGFVEIELARKAGVSIEALFYCPTFARQKVAGGGELFEVPENIFKKISLRESPDGFLALAKPKPVLLKNIKLNPNPLLIVLETVEKPGNLGAIYRSAEAAGADAVIISNPRTDIYNPNVIRASLGTVFACQTGMGANSEVILWLKENKIRIFAAAPAAKKSYAGEDYSGSSAIVIGTEHEGLSGEWLAAADEKIKIPMSGKINSLNASVSLAVILFEAKRQRG